MTERRKGIGGRRWKINLDFQEPKSAEKCTLCGEDVEANPMKEGVCYDCYRGNTNASTQMYHLERVLEENLREQREIASTLDFETLEKDIAELEAITGSSADDEDWHDYQDTINSVISDMRPF